MTPNSETTGGASDTEADFRCSKPAWKLERFGGALCGASSLALEATIALERFCCIEPDRVGVGVRVGDSVGGW